MLFETVAYRGAFGADNWAACWCEWDPDNANYDNGPINYMPVVRLLLPREVQVFVQEKQLHWKALLDLAPTFGVMEKLLRISR